MTRPMTAAELDLFLATKAAYELALVDGADEDTAIDVARDAAREVRRQQMLRRLGIEDLDERAAGAAGGQAPTAPGGG